MTISFCNLLNQYQQIQSEIDTAIADVMQSSDYINGKQVKIFAENLAKYLNVKHVIPCGNGTDALQIALMALDLKQGDEVIVPAFTYVATAEVIALLKLTPVMVDVDLTSFNVTLKNIQKALSSKSKAIVPVHLFGQSCNMDPIIEFAKEQHLYVLEDNAQALGAYYQFKNGLKKRTGTIGTIGCTSFFPTKNLGCYGDGGAMITDNDELAKKLKMITTHGQSQKYHHEIQGCNSRLDTLQAAILNVKLKYLDNYEKSRYCRARYYSERLIAIPEIITPIEMPYSTHVYHQYTLQIKNGKRDALKSYLWEQGIPTMVYYPLPLNKQKAFFNITRQAEPLTVSKELTNTVLSLPIDTVITKEQQEYIIDHILKFFNA